MATLSLFYGIIIRMFQEVHGKHNLPHIHAKYAEFEIVVDIQGNVLEGSFPVKQQRLLLAWIALHEDDLKANWELLSEGEQFFKIEPLK